MNTFFNSLLRPESSSPVTTTTYTPYERSRKRPEEVDDDDDAPRTEPTPKSYDITDKRRAVAGPSREEFDKHIEEKQAALAMNRTLQIEIEKLKRLNHNAMNEIQRRANYYEQQQEQQRQANAQNAQAQADADLARLAQLQVENERARQAQEQANAEQLRLAQEQARAEQARLAQEQASAEQASNAEAEMLRLQKEAADQRAWFEQQLDEMKRQRDLSLKEKEERDAEIFNLRNRQQSSGPNPSQGASSSSSPAGTSSSAQETTSSQAPGNSSARSTDFANLIKESVDAAIAAAFANYSPPPPPAATPRSRQRGNQLPKPGSLAHRREIKKSALDQLSKDDEKRWRDYLRRCFRDMTNQTHVTDFRSYSPIEEVIAQAFEKGEGPGPEMSYRLYFGKNYQHSRWNKAIIVNMLAFAADRKEQYRIRGDLNEDALKAIFHDFIKEAQTSWACANPRLGDHDSVETPQEARTRAKQTVELHKETSRINQRKRAKFALRKTSVNLLQRALPLTASQFDRSKLDQTQNVLMTLGHDGMSSEESDGEGGLVITVPHYRRRIVSQMMNDLDRDGKGLLDAQNYQLRNGRRPQPKFVRRRAEKRSERKVKKGLPISLYHRSYLARLADPFREKLEIPEMDLPYFDQWALAIQENSDSEDDNMATQG